MDTHVHSYSCLSEYDCDDPHFDYSVNLFLSKGVKTKLKTKLSGQDLLDSQDLLDPPLLCTIGWWIVGRGSKPSKLKFKDHDKLVVTQRNQHLTDR